MYFDSFTQVGAFEVSFHEHILELGHYRVKYHGARQTDEQIHEKTQRLRGLVILLQIERQLLHIRMQTFAHRADHFYLERNKW